MKQQQPRLSLFSHTPFLPSSLYTHRLWREAAVLSHRGPLALFPRLRRHLGVLLVNTALLGPLCRALGAVPNLHCERAAREVRVDEEPEGIARLCGAAGRVGLGLAAGYDADRRREAAEGLGLHSISKLLAPERRDDITRER